MQMELFFSPNSGEDQKKRSSSKVEHFFSPNSGEDQKRKKKKVFITNRALFSPNFRSDTNPFKILGGMQMWTILKLLGGCSQILGGYIPPSPPGFGTPGCSSPFSVALRLNFTLFCIDRALDIPASSFPKKIKNSLLFFSYKSG